MADYLTIRETSFALDLSVEQIRKLIDHGILNRINKTGWYLLETKEVDRIRNILYYKTKRRKYKLTKDVMEYLEKHI